jgi:hypothetical protein
VAASTGPPGSTFLTVILTVIDGPYEGTVFRLVQSKGRKEFVVGRSTGKKVKEHGASMPQDPEVSTVHGRFECRAGGKVMYEDLGSTNGSFINGCVGMLGVARIDGTGGRDEASKESLTRDRARSMVYLHCVLSPVELVVWYACTVFVANRGFLMRYLTLLSHVYIHARSPS